jgi:hypothetical protein
LHKKSMRTLNLASTIANNYPLATNHDQPQ